MRNQIHYPEETNFWVFRTLSTLPWKRVSFNNYESFSINLHSFRLTTNMIDALLDLRRIQDLFELSNTFLFLLSAYGPESIVFYHL